MLLALCVLQHCGRQRHAGCRAGRVRPAEADAAAPMRRQCWAPHDGGDGAYAQRTRHGSETLINCKTTQKTSKKDSKNGW
jgi:hypothetical protein